MLELSSCVIYCLGFIGLFFNEDEVIEILIFVVLDAAAFMRF